MPDARPTPPAPGSLLTIDDVAAVLRTTPKQVYHMRSRGQIPGGRKVPGLGIRYHRASFEKWLEDGGACE